MKSAFAIVMSSLVFVHAVQLAGQTPQLTEEEQQVVDRLFARPKLDPSIRLEALKFDATAARDVIDEVAKMAGVTVRYDQAVPELDTRISVNIVKLSIAEALEAVLGANQLAYKVLGSKQVFIYSNTDANRTKFTESIKTFYLTNGDPAFIVSTLNLAFRSGDGIRPMMMTNERSRAITVKATPDKMAEIAKIIAANDKR